MGLSVHQCVHVKPQCNCGASACFGNLGFTAHIPKAQFPKFPVPESQAASCTGKPVAFKLIPQGGPALLAKPYSLVAKRGLFATKHLWVTPHKEEERYASGDWVLQANGGDGLEEWVKQVGDRSTPSICMNLCRLTTKALVVDLT